MGLNNDNKFRTIESRTLHRRAMKRLMLLMLPVFAVFAQPCLAGKDVTVTLRLDRTEATLDDSISMVVNVSGTRKTDGRPVIDGVEAFDVNAGGTSTRVEIVNTKVTSGIDHTYTLLPKRAGTFTIGPAKVTVDGNVFQSNAQTLTIAKPGRATGLDRGPVFLEAALSKDEAYVEEQVIYTLKLYTQLGGSDLSLELPADTNLGFRQLGKPTEYDGSHNGRAYHVLEVRYVMVPSAPGQYGIAPSRLRLTVYPARSRRPRGFFNDSFFPFSSGKQKILASDRVNLNVLPLPKEDMPAGFSGLVGSFTMDADLAPGRIASGASATLTVTVSGRGNVKRIPELDLGDLENIKIYADQPVLDETADRMGIRGSKAMKWALVPEKPGRYTLPTLSITYFDPVSGDYRTAETPSLELSVAPGEEREAQAPAPAPTGQIPVASAKKEIRDIGRDILPIHGAIKNMTAVNMRPGRALFLLALLTPLLVYVSTWCGLKLSNKSDASEAAARARKAARAFARQCREGKPNAGQMISVVRMYLNDRFGMTLGSLTPGEAADILQSAGVTKDTAAALASRLRELEDRVYTGRGEDACRPGEDMSDLIRQIEWEIR